MDFDILIVIFLIIFAVLALAFGYYIFFYVEKHRVPTTKASSGFEESVERGYVRRAPRVQFHEMVELLEFPRNRYVVSRNSEDREPSVPLNQPITVDVTVHREAPEDDEVVEFEGIDVYTPVEEAVAGQVTTV